MLSHGHCPCAPVSHDIPPRVSFTRQPGHPHISASQLKTPSLLRACCSTLLKPHQAFCREREREDDDERAEDAGEATIQMPETKVAYEASEIGTMNGPLRNPRLACLLTSVTALSLMVTAEESSTISIFGFSLPLYSKWSFSDSFE